MARSILSVSLKVVSALAKFPRFASVNGVTFYRLPLNEGTITLERSGSEVPLAYSTGAEMVVPFHAGETLAWRLIPREGADD